MVQHIEELEQLHKQTCSQKVWGALNQEVDRKLLEAQIATKKTMFTQQRWFEHSDKPGRFLAQFLADRPG